MDKFSKAHKDINISNGGKTITGNGSNISGWGNAYGSMDIDSTIENTYEWKFTIDKIIGYILIGITSQPDINADYSQIDYAYDARYGYKYHFGIGEQYTNPCNTDDIVTMIVDFKNKTIHYNINDQQQNMAFENIKIGPTYKMVVRINTDALDKHSVTINEEEKAPIEPVEPVEPVVPVEPAEPVEPPAEPPVEPAEPVEPPAEPVEPPVEPVEPAEPVEPHTFDDAEEAIAEAEDLYNDYKQNKNSDPIFTAGQGSGSDTEDTMEVNISFTNIKIQEKLLAEWSNDENTFDLLEIKRKENDNAEEEQELGFTLKFNQDFALYEGDPEEQKKFQDNVIAILAKKLSIDPNSIIIGELREGSVIVDFTIDKKGTQEIFENIILPQYESELLELELQSAAESDTEEKNDEKIDDSKSDKYNDKEIRNKIKKEYPFDINDKTEKEIANEKKKKELINIRDKLEHVSNKNNQSINRLKKQQEESKSDYNDEIVNLEKCEANVFKLKREVQNDIQKCSKVIWKEMRSRKRKWKYFIHGEELKEHMKLEYIENVKHQKNTQLLSMVVISKLNIVITSATDEQLIFWKTDKNKNNKCKSFAKMSIAGNALLLRCSKDEKYLIAACENSQFVSLIIVISLYENDTILLDNINIKYCIESNKHVKFYTPNAMEISNDNRYIFYAENGSKISIIDLNTKIPQKIGEIGFVGIKDIIKGISVTNNLLIFGGESGLIGAFFLCLLEKTNNEKQSSSHLLKQYRAAKLSTSKKRSIEDVSISDNEKFLSVCGKRKIQCFNVIFNKKKLNTLTNINDYEKLIKNMNQMLKIKANSKLIESCGKQLTFNKGDMDMKSDIFAVCDDDKKNGVSFKVYDVQGKGVTVINEKQPKEKTSFASQIQFMNDMCVIAFQTKSRKKNNPLNPPECYVWNYKMK